MLSALFGRPHEVRKRLQRQAYEFDVSLRLGDKGAKAFRAYPTLTVQEPIRLPSEICVQGVGSRQEVEYG